MEYYTRDGKCVNYKCDISSEMKGKQSIVYRLLDDPLRCLKVYLLDEQVEEMYRGSNKHFGCDMFYYLKYDFNHPNFYKLDELLFDDKLKVVLSYTLKYYEQMVENILDLPVSYLLDNYNLLYNAVVRLATDFVMTLDLHEGNIINTSDGMVVIDCDQYVRGNDRNYVSYFNREALLYAFYRMIKSAFKKKGIDVDKEMNLKFKLLGMFNMDSSILSDFSPLTLKNKLRGCKTSMDYFDRWKF